MGFLTGLLEAKDASGDATARATSGSRSAAFGGWGLGQVGNWDVDKAVTHGLEKVVWVFRCVDVIASCQASLPIGQKRILSFQDRDKGEWIDDERIWRLLNMRANNYEFSNQFRYRVSGNLLLSKRGAFIEVVKGADGRPSELHVLPSNMVNPVPHPELFVEKYLVNRADGGIDELAKEDVIWIKLKPHPTDPYMQLTPLMAAGISAETDYLAHLFNRNFLATDGRPGLLVSIQGQINPVDAQEIKNRFSGGPLRAGEATVIEADGVSVADMSATPRDTQWNDLLRASKEEILLAFGVPESLMGNASGRTFDNAAQERENFWMDTEVNHCEAIANALDAITDDDEDNIVIAYDYSKVDVLQRARKERLEQKRGEVEMGLATIDEYLEEAGHDPWDIPGTRVLYQPSGLVVGKSKEDTDAVRDLPVIGAPPQQEEEQQEPFRPGWRTPARREEVDEGWEEASHPESKSFPRAARSYNHELEADVEDGLTKWMLAQADTATSPGTKAIHPMQVLDVQEWVDMVKELTLDKVRRAVIREMKQSANDLEAMVGQDVLRERGFNVPRRGTALTRVFGSREAHASAVDYVMVQVEKIVEDAGYNQTHRILRKIDEMDREGRTERQIRLQVRRMIGQRSPWRRQLAINMTTTAMESAAMVVMNRARGLILKTWNSEDDERVRPTHHAADGKEVLLEHPFQVGMSFLQFPGDPSGPLNEVVNCRCFLTFRANPDEGAWR